VSTQQSFRSYKPDFGISLLLEIHQSPAERHLRNAEWEYTDTCAYARTRGSLTTPSNEQVILYSQLRTSDLQRDNYV
jgi:hypothetical protein